MKIGTTVHWVTPGAVDGSFDKQCMAAIVTEDLGDNELNLFVMYETGSAHRLEVEMDYNEKGGTWHLPDDCEEDV